MSETRQIELLAHEHDPGAENSKVECLGLTFGNEEERRAYFRERLRVKLADPAFREIEGFPLGADDAILELSDPPYYTACPNPFIEDFIGHYGRPYDPSESYHREPFAADVSEGKNDPIYSAHTYHTKVPHKAIMRYILHYTEPGDIVYDGFCGTGMTGVAAQLCGDHKTVGALGYQVDAQGNILQQTSDAGGKAAWQPFSKLGARRAILNDLSPAATFIAHNYNTPVDVHEFELEAKRILAEVEKECGWMYETIHSDGKTKGRINYTVWSDVFMCPDCMGEIVFSDLAVDKASSKVLAKFACPGCDALLTKRALERAWETKFDKAISKTVRQAKQVPVLINYSVGKVRHEKTPDARDLALIRQIEAMDIPHWFPVMRMPEGYNTEQPKVSHGLTHVHHFYTKRNLHVVAGFKKRASRHYIDNLLQSVSPSLSTKIVRYNMGRRGNGPVSGTLYVPSLVAEANVFRLLQGKIKAFRTSSDRFVGYAQSSISTNSSTVLMTLQKDSVDYIFVDPPFGGNLMYSELNYIWEAWLKVHTNNRPEAIINQVQCKGMLEYQQLMTRCFQEYYRVLKPGRWMTVEFHNSNNSIWTAIQEALQHAGFVVADVSTLDKRQGTFKQVTSSNAVKQDLIISAYKPNDGLEERFKLTAGTPDAAWDFVRGHLKQLPVFVTRGDQAEIIAERQDYLLYDRMVAFHVQRGATVPLSAADFYQGLAERFPRRDGMYFLPDQLAEYDKKRLTVREVQQLRFIVSDEASAIQWLRQQLQVKPQTFQDLQPQFMQEISGWQRYEKQLELIELLEQNFLRYDGSDEVPSQIHGYLSTNFKDMRNLAKDDANLQAKAKDRWYVPDPNKAGDLEKLRERALLRQFIEYTASDVKRLRKDIRTEALRAGFKKAWSERDYQTIIQVAEKVPETVLQEDPKLLMWYDQSITRTQGL